MPSATSREETLKDWTTASWRDTRIGWESSATSRVVTVKHLHPLRAVQPNTDAVGIKSQRNKTEMDPTVNVSSTYNYFIHWQYLSLNSISWKIWKVIVEWTLLVGYWDWIKKVPAINIKLEFKKVLFILKTEDSFFSFLMTSSQNGSHLIKGIPA